MGLFPATVGGFLARLGWNPRAPFRLRRIELTSPLKRSVHRTAVKLSTAISRFDAQLRADGKSPHTRAVYLRDLEAFASWIGKSADIRRFRPTHLARYLSSESFTHMPSGQPRAVVSLNRSKSALRSFFRFLTDAGCLKQNPARLVRSAPCYQKPPSCLSPEEAQRLLAAMRKDKTPIAERDHLMFSLMLGTGIRLGSLVGLNIGDVDLAAGTIRVNGKGNVELLVFVNNGLKRLLKAHTGIRNPADPVFISVRGRRIGSRQVQLRLELWLKEAGIASRCTVHSLRHCFATRLYEKTGDLRLVQRALGHRHVTTTEIYSQVADARVRRAVRLLGSTR